MYIYIDIYTLHLCIIDLIQRGWHTLRFPFQIPVYQLSLVLKQDSNEAHFFTIFNPLNAELLPFCHLLALLGAHHIFHVSRISVKPTLTTAQTAAAYCGEKSGSILITYSHLQLLSAVSRGTRFYSVRETKNRAC